VVTSSPHVIQTADDLLVSLLKQDAVPMATLHARHSPFLKIVHALLGVVPNCDMYLEIWPPAFRTYNIMVPNFFNIPFSIFGLGGAPKDIVGLGMYVASRTAECPYCSAHTCSFALRRGVSPETVAQALVGGAALSPRELATVAVARSLSRIPCELTEAERQELNKHFTPMEAEWVVSGIVMMGFLNKFMDAVSVELEASTVAEVTSSMGAGWSSGKSGRELDPAAQRTAPPPADSFWTKLSIVPSLPAAIRLDRRWQRGVPNSWPAVGEFLRAKTGHDFPVLSRMRNTRVIQSVATMLRENLDPATSVTGLNVKVLAGVIFAAVVADAPLGADVRALGRKHGVTSAQLDAAARFAISADAEPEHTDPKVRAALLLARAASPSPAEVNAYVVGECRQAGFSAPEIVELITWLSVLQMLHRLSSYFATDRAKN
jgi:alkylhydroperoxidase family enzyme